MSAAKHTPGTWRAVEVSPFLGPQFKPYWLATRDDGRRYENMKGADGKELRFPTKAAALSAIAKATGSA